MPRLPRISGKDAIKVLEKLGFVIKRQRGSHVVLTKETKAGKVGCVVPLHKELALGTLKGILRQGNVDVEEFIENL